MATERHQHMRCLGCQRYKRNRVAKLLIEIQSLEKKQEKLTEIINFKDYFDFTLIIFY